MLTWLVQIIDVEKEKFNQLLDALDRFNIDFKLVYPKKDKIFLSINGEEFIPEKDKNYFVCGSYLLAQNAEKLIKNAVFNIDKYGSDEFLEIFGKHNFVNGDIKIVNSNNINWNENEKLFIRPINDVKNFNGGVYTKETFNYKGDVAIAKIKEISQEYRFFVVDKEIVSGSSYKLNGKFFESENIDDGAIRFAKEMISLFNEDNYALDIAKINNEYKIVELNCINSAGFYKNDLFKFVIAIENYYENKKMELNLSKKMKM